MKQSIYLIRDMVSNQSSPLFLAPNDKTAEREFVRFLDSEKLPTAKEDYELLNIGTFAPDACEIIGMAKYTVMVGGSSEVENV